MDPSDPATILVNESFQRYQSDRAAHWDVQARRMRSWKSAGRYYHTRLEQIYRFLIPEGTRVLEVGCATGDLLAALKPSRGVGIDFSTEMIRIARQQYPGLCFIQADIHELVLDEKFDFIILSDTLNDLWDVQLAFKKITPLCTASTRILINCYNKLWELPLQAARALKLATPNLHQNWLTGDDVKNLLYLEGFETIRNWKEVFCPVNIPLLASFCNRFLVRLWPFNGLALTNFTMARPAPQTIHHPQPTVSVIIPARNEAGNIPAIFRRTPEMGAGTELVFVEGGSTDNTRMTIEQSIKEHPDRKAVLLQQDGKGKGDAVRKGFANASGDILMILDADLTVLPEDLPRFYEALVTGKGDLINGVRLVYPMEKEAMRFLNLLGNKFFSLVFSWLLGQAVKDTLCGTKVLWKQDYEAIAANRFYFGDFDPFGDFDLIFGASKLNFKITDIPVRYRERTYGSTNINRWKHGWLLLRMVMFAARRLKFV
ncbi:MAG: glycosyltransferase [Chloroflexi bacterium]|nr:glycosyltransferase [Chloroflexota bacterium]